METTIKQVMQWGNSLGVQISKDAAKRAGITKGSSVRVVASRGTVTLTKVSIKSKVTLPILSQRDILRGLTPDVMLIDREWLDMVPVGKEIVEYEEN